MMPLAYFLRLAVLSLAAFLFVNLIAGAVVSWITPEAIRRAARWRPLIAARVLFALRILPSALAVFVVAGFIVPSYLLFEPEFAGENVRMWLILAALLGGALLFDTAIRALASLFRALVSTRRTLAFARKSSGIWIIDGTQPCIAVAGIVKPRILVSSGMMEALPAGEMAAALRHERAHQISRDNLKRLVLLFAPGILPFLGSYRSLEQAWREFTEWAADDLAAGGDKVEALNLAAALVRVARIGPVALPSPLATSLATDGTGLQKRVERLLSAAPVQGRRWPALLVTMTSIALVGLASIVIFQTTTYYSVHDLLERIIR
jgi:Zn-dependent protease with chaperone function